MPNPDRRTAARRRAWGRGPATLRFESLEGRQLLTTGPDLVASSFSTVHNLDWGANFHASGTITNQGDTAAPNAFLVDVYAVPSADIATAPNADANAVKVGTVAMTGGLAPGASQAFSQDFTLPTTAIPNVGNAIDLRLVVDPTNTEGEASTTDKANLGPGVDTSAVYIVPGATDPTSIANALLGNTTPAAATSASSTTSTDATTTPTTTTTVKADASHPAVLVGSGFTIGSNSTLSWGGQINIQAQITDASAVDAPATRARIVLTPQGATPGGDADVSLASLVVPAVAAGQTVDVSGAIPLPAKPTSTLGNISSFTVSMVQDSDYVANPLGIHTPDQGDGLDSAPVTITSAPYTVVHRPDLAAKSVTAPDTLQWGQTFQVSTTVTNTGKADANDVRVRFWLASTASPATNALFLGDAVVPTLASQVSQGITQTVTLPDQPPPGLDLKAGSPAHIIAQVDPEQIIDMVDRSTTVATSSPITLKLIKVNGTTVVPGTTANTTLAPPVTLTTTVAPSTTTTPTPQTPQQIRAAKLAAAKEARAAAVANRTTHLAQAQTAGHLEATVSARKAAAEARAVAAKLKASGRKLRVVSES